MERSGLEGKMGHVGERRGGSLKRPGSVHLGPLLTWPPGLAGWAAPPRDPELPPCAPGTLTAAPSLHFPPTALWEGPGLGTLSLTESGHRRGSANTLSANECESFGNVFVHRALVLELILEIGPGTSPSLQTNVDFVL